MATTPAAPTAPRAPQTGSRSIPLVIRPHPTTGWDDDAGEGDTLLRRFVHHHAATTAAFAAAAGGIVRDVGPVHLADARQPAGFWNAATLLRPVEDWAGTIGSLLRVVAGGRGDLFLWSLWPIPDLSRFGFELMGHPPLLVRAPHRLLPAPDPSDGIAEEVVSLSQLGEWEQVMVRGYPFPDADGVPGSLGPAPVLADPRIRLWIGREGGRAVSAATSFVSHGLASLALGATLPQSRGRGHWRALALTRVHANPARWTVGVFSDHSRPLAESLGFVPITRLTLWCLARPG